MENLSSGQYEPLPRWGHASVAIGDKVYMWGGRTDYFSENAQKELSRVVEVFDTTTEMWVQRSTSGTPPPGLYNNAHTVLGNAVYVYGGWDGQSAHNHLHCLDTSSFFWAEVTINNPSEAPMKMSGCAMVPYGDHKLVLFGGYGVITEGSQQPGSTFYYIREDKGWTNELRVFNVEKGTWSSPTTTGARPPPCVDFSFTKVDDHRAVVFGGYQPETGSVCDSYMLNMETWHWSKLPKTDEPHPKGRDGHASCLLSSSPSPQLLITGGWDKADQALRDAWLLDVNSGSWRELSFPPKVGLRFWHSVTVVEYSLRLRHVLYFGGCPGTQANRTTWPKLAHTVLVELGTLPTAAHISPLREVGEGERGMEEWAVMDAVWGSQLGQPLRRMRETVLLTRYRALYAEKKLQGLIEKIQLGLLHLPTLSHPKDSVPDDEETLCQATASNKVQSMGDPEKAEEEKWAVARVANSRVTAKSLFSQTIISQDNTKVCFTGEEVPVMGGRWAVMKVADIRMASKSQIISKDNRKVFMDVAAKLHHSNLLPFIRAVLEGKPIFITELISQNLKFVLDRYSLAQHQVVGIAIDIAKALDFLHSTTPDPVIHGELSSTAVLLEQGPGAHWKAKLSDFVTAKFFQQVLLMSTTSNKIFGSSTGSFGFEMCMCNSPLDASLSHLIKSIKWKDVMTLIQMCLEVDPEKQASMQAQQILEKLHVVTNNQQPISPLWQLQWF